MRVLLVCVLAFNAATACAGWTGVRVFVNDPQASWDGTSDCAPCNQFCSDLAKYTRGTEWRVGFSQYQKAGGLPYHFAILRALPHEPVPYFEAVTNGEHGRTIVGYKGDIQAIVDLYTGPTKKESPPSMNIRGFTAGCSCGCGCPNCQCGGGIQVGPTTTVFHGPRTPWAPATVYTTINGQPVTVDINYDGPGTARTRYAGTPPWRGSPSQRCVNGVCW